MFFFKPNLLLVWSSAVDESGTVGRVLPSSSMRKRALTKTLGFKVGNGK